MNTRLAENKNIYTKEPYPLLYLVKKEYKSEARTKVKYFKDSGVFPIFLAIILFLCLGILFNIGLKIQNINYQKKIYETTEMISLENERTDRLLLKISELQSPSRIIEIAKSNLGMQMSDDMEVIKISNKGLDNNEKIFDYIVKGLPPMVENYDSFIGTIYYIQDIVMVVSESVLTFFIP